MFYQTSKICKNGIRNFFLKLKIYSYFLGYIYNKRKILIYGNNCEHTRTKIREIGRQPLSWILFLAYLYCWMRYSYQIDKMNSRMLKNMRSTLFTIYACNYTLYMYI